MILRLALYTRKKEADNKKNNFKKKFLPSTLFLVEPVLVDIRFYLWGNQIFYRLPLMNELPNFRRGDIEKRNLLKIELSARKMNPDLVLKIILKGGGEGPRELRGDRGLIEARSCHHNKMAESKEILKILPGFYFDKGIPSQDKEKGLSTPFTKMAKGIYGVRFPGSKQFNVRDGKKRVGGNRQFYHFKPIGCIDDIVQPFMGRDGCWNEDDLIQAKTLPDLLRPPEVAQMNGVKGPSKKSDPFLRSSKLLGDLFSPLVPYCCPQPDTRSALQKG